YIRISVVVLHFAFLMLLPLSFFLDDVAASDLSDFFFSSFCFDIFLSI
ncbi:MAG: hypothetical protein ACI8WW_002072, partial [Oceanospirillaceae bacterium]